jgi:hypothetical protein
MQQHGRADAHRLTVYRCHQRLWKAHEGAQQPEHRMLQIELRTGQKVLQIVTSAKPRARTAEHYNTHRPVRLGALERNAERLVHREGNGVALLGTVEPHFEHAVRMRQEDLVAHARKLAAPTGRKATSVGVRLGRVRPEIDIAVGCQPHQHGPGRHVLIKLLAVDLIKGVVGCMVNVEVA